MSNNRIKPFLNGVAASAILLGIYFTALTLVSGWNFAQSQFAAFWYFIVSLAVGFGIQIGLYSRLKQLVERNSAGKTVAVTGTTSALSMISCCTHYLVNILPVLGTIGVVTFVAQYQTQFFWIGLAFNLGGIAFIGNKIIRFKKRHE